MSYRKLGRTSAQRKAMLRDLTTDLIINERIETTETRAKELRSVVEKMITLGKRGDLHARRQAAAYIRNEVANEENNQDALQNFVFDQHAFFEAYGALLKQLKRKGLPKRDSETLRDYAKRIDEKYDIEDMSKLTLSYERALYRNEDSSALWNDSRELWENLIKRRWS